MAGFYVPLAILTRIFILVARKGGREGKGEGKGRKKEKGRKGKRKKERRKKEKGRLYCGIFWNAQSEHSLLWSLENPLF